MKKMITTTEELLYWTYANLAMAHAALSDNADTYRTKHYMIRSKLFKGLLSKTMNIRSFYDDERLKMLLPQACCYCGSSDNLSADHMIPRKKGGLDTGENIVWACRKCNSSKSTKDLLEWMHTKGTFPSILLYRRYLKSVINYCQNNSLMEVKLDRLDAKLLEAPFSLSAISQPFPSLETLRLWVVTID